MKSKFIYIFLVIVCCVFGQKLSTSVDKQSINIGQPIQYVLQFHDQKNPKIITNFKNQLQKSKFELISYKIDSISLKNTISYTFKITSFEQGKQQIPSFKFKIFQDSLQTTSYLINVLEVKISDPNKFKDIKNIEEVPMNFLDYLYFYQNYIYLFISILAFIFLIFWLIKKFKSRIQKQKNKNLFEQTLFNLNTLKQKKYIENNEFKTFYIELSDILKDFLFLEFNIPSKILISSDLIDFIETNKNLENDDFIMFKSFIQIADLVKFAKSIPEKSMAENHYKIIFDFVKKEQIKKENIEKETLNNSKKSTKK